MLCIYHTLASFSLILVTSLIAMITQCGTSHSGIKNITLCLCTTWLLPVHPYPRADKFPVNQSVDHSES